ncbi:hypothetical protein [Salinirussus salinus]|uniref:hypothetical protein n=1 Tax=Salinirussus salinus TaxID=1198300 RepID=UPI00135A7953|nr:hypothetical protein [Salinirussus salinus]
MIPLQATSYLNDVIVPLLVGLLGFAGGVFSRVGKYMYEKRTRTKKLRAAILMEVRSPRSAINDLEEMDPENTEGFDHTTIPTKVYDAHIEDVGLLSVHEVEEIVDYYSIVAVANSQISDISGSETTSELEPFLNETVPGLKSARDDAEKILKTHYKLFGKYRYRFVRLCGWLHDLIVRMFPILDS